MVGQRPASGDAGHYFVKRPNEIIPSKRGWNEARAEPRGKGNGADEVTPFRGLAAEGGTEHRDTYADSRTQATEHSKQEG